MCCGSRRAAWRAASTPSRAPTASPSDLGPAFASLPAADGPSLSAPGGFPTTPVRFGGGAGMRVRGPVTGTLYEFSPDRPILPVDVRDAAVLRRNTVFRVGA
jgi:hypothetical protein